MFEFHFIFPSQILSETFSPTLYELRQQQAAFAQFRKEELPPRVKVLDKLQHLDSELPQGFMSSSGTSGYKIEEVGTSDVVIFVARFGHP